MKYQNLGPDEKDIVDEIADLWIESGGDEEDFIAAYNAIRERIVELKDK